MTTNNTEEKIKKIIHIGSDVIGTTSGRVLGFILGGMEGAVIGSAVGVCTKELLKTLGRCCAAQFIK